MGGVPPPNPPPNSLQPPAQTPKTPAPLNAPVEPVDAATLRAWDQQHVWHPYTQMADPAIAQAPLITRAEGCKLHDIDGNTYWDGVSSIWLNVHGHRVPAIDQAIRDQLDRVAHSTLLGQGNVPATILAQRLAHHAPGNLNRVFFSDNGSTAVETALKMAIQYWHLQGQPNKNRIAAMEGGYHGDTLGCVAAAFVPAFHAPFASQIPASNIALPWPDMYRGPHPGDADATQAWALQEAEKLLSRHAHQLAALIVEPMVQGVGGIRVMPPGYLRGLRELCTRHNILLIADEVATGFGRTGTLFACNHENVTPDLMALGKGLTGGYLPLAATLASEEIYAAFLGDYRDMKTFFHGHSFTGNQLGCAAALASLDLLEPLLPQLPAKAERLHAGLAPLRDLPHVGDVRGLGMMAGIELVANKQTRQPLDWKQRPGWIIFEEARKRGLLARPYASVGILMPPLAATHRDIDTMTRLYCEAAEAAMPQLATLAHQETPPAPAPHPTPDRPLTTAT